MIQTAAPAHLQHPQTSRCAASAATGRARLHPQALVHLQAAEPDTQGSPMQLHQGSTAPTTSPSRTPTP